MTALILFFGGCWVINEIIHYRVKVAKARLLEEKARQEAIQVLLGSLISGKMVISAGAAPQEKIDEFVGLMDELAFKMGKRLEITIED